MFQGHKVLAILNPSSGSSKGEALAATLEDLVLRLGAAACEVRVTQGPDDALNWSLTAADDGYDMLIAGGGDGTVTAVAQGVVGSESKAPIAILPLGTANGLARVLGLPLEPEDTLAAIAAGRAVPLDVIEVTSHDTISLLFCGAGVDAVINEEADREAKDRLGIFAYIWAALKAARGTRRRHVTVAIDGSTSHVRAHSVVAFNATRLEVLGLKVGPDASPHDGRMDVAILRTPGVMAVLRKALRLMDRSASRTELTPATRLRIEVRPPLPVQVDGDPIGETPLELRVLAGAVSFVAPAEYEGDARGH